MVSLDCATTTAGDVTLVTLSLSSGEPTHVRVENCLDGPVLPPRTQGVPAAGWDETGFSGVVDGTLALGYACPVVSDADTPAELVETRPPTDDDGPTARSLVRDLGDPSPPPEAAGPPGTADRQSPADGEPTAPPPAVTAWLDDVATRLDEAERLATATSVTEATEAVAAVGGPERVCTLREQLVADRETLAAVEARCNALAADVEHAEIPVETLTRLA